MTDLDFWFDLMSVRSFAEKDMAWQSEFVLTEISVMAITVYSRKRPESGTRNRFKEKRKRVNEG
jgi:hypothetical protein